MKSRDMRDLDFKWMTRRGSTKIFLAIIPFFLLFIFVIVGTYRINDLKIDVTLAQNELQYTKEENNRYKSQLADYKKVITGQEADLRTLTGQISDENNRYSRALEEIRVLLEENIRLYEDNRKLARELARIIEYVGGLPEVDIRLIEEEKK